MYSANYDVITQKSNLILLSFMEFVNNRNKKTESTKRKYIAVNRQRTNKNCAFLAIKEHVLDLLSGVPKRNSKISYFSLFFCKILDIIYKSVVSNNKNFFEAPENK